MGKLIAGIMRTLGQVAVVLFVLMIIAIGMIGVYRVAKLSWKGHLVMWAACLICGSLASWIFGSTFDWLSISAGLVIFSVVSEGLVWAYESLGIYELMTEDSPLDSAEEKGESREHFFGMFSSLFMVSFVLVGAYWWNGEDPFIVSEVTQTLKSILGYIMMCLGFGLPIIGFAAYMMLNEQNN